ncbi:hypothetical protein [Bacteroides fragilis]|uniref:hypothetical protein n=1 Tax=Bacteroides fragilis TaxID=817 RepID=UPI00202F833A|nr:hypothetical protein [Bacteroides fragilis]
MKRLPLVIDNMPKEEQKTISFFIGRNLAESEVPLLLITRKEIEYGEVLFLLHLQTRKIKNQDFPLLKCFLLLLEGDFSDSNFLL